MNVMSFKKCILNALFFMCPFFAAALPGVDSKIKDRSGEYVFYRDLSFKKQATVGFAFYDDSTYAIRFYSPSENTDITLYISINPKNPALEFTGETINGFVRQDDAEIVNYLHDLFYEFTERRQKVTLGGYDVKTQAEDFVQFGGQVNVRYNPIVPIFNIESISSYDGTPQFTLVTQGLLSSSNDTSFSDFTGFAEKLPADKLRDFKLKSSKLFRTTYEGLSVSLDNNWQQSKGMQNLWLLDEVAILTLVKFSVPKELSSEDFLNTMQRSLCQSSSASYLIWEQLTAKKTSNGFTVANVFFQPQISNVTRDFQTLRIESDGTASLFKMTVFDSTYKEYKNYFDNIVKSFK